VRQSPREPEIAVNRAETRAAAARAQAAEPRAAVLDDLDALPGGDLVRAGLADLGRGVESAPALLVSIGAPRLARLGLAIPGGGLPDPETRLYLLLAADGPDAAHSRYNALIRRLVSFERAAECAARSTPSASTG
jgi:hypothetical protein